MDGGGYNGDVSVINKRRGDNSAQNGLVEYSIEPKPEIKKIFEEGGMPTPSFNQLKKNDNKAIDTFKNAIAKAKQSLGGYGASVELKDDYTDINLYLSEDGESGFGIKPNGDIVSVFSNNKAEGGRSHYMLEMATAEGGRQLDCFDIYLTKIYEAHGFKPIAYIDAKKKEFKESDVNRDEDGKFAEKPSSKNKKDNDKKENDKSKDNSNPKKSNCNVGDTYNIAINDMATIPAKKIAESDNYELYEENANKLKPQQRKAIENAINNISKQYNELFNIYGKSDNQPTKKLKIVLLDESRKKKLKSTAGFVIKEGADNEEDNSIFLNTSAIKKEKENNIQKIIAHETIHTIINDNLRNKKMYFRPSNLLEKALAESGTFIVDGDNYREPPEDLDIDKKTKWILYNKYYFTSNLMYYLYLKNNKNSDIFKDIVNNMQGKEDSKFANAIQKTANKIGIEGGFSEIIKYWIKDKYNFNDEEAGDFKRTLMIKLENPKW